MKNNSKSIILILVSAIFPLVAQWFLGKNALIKNSGMFIGFWIVMNYLFFSTVVELISSYSKMFRLKGLSIVKATFYINLIVYGAFVIFLNSYFLQQLYIRDNEIINTIATPIVVIVILITFLMNLMCGLFPKKESNENINVYTVSNSNSFKFGREIFGILVGTYNEGIVIGNLSINYDDIKSIYLNKKNQSLILKGKDSDGQFRLSIDAPKTRNATILLIEKALRENKIDKKIINI